MKNAVQMKVFIILSHCSSREPREVRGAGVDKSDHQGRNLKWNYPTDCKESMLQSEWPALRDYLARSAASDSFISSQFRDWQMDTGIAS